MRPIAVLPDAVCTNQSREIRRTFVFPQDPPDLNLQIQYGHPSICHAAMLPCKCNRLPAYCMVVPLLTRTYSHIRKEDCHASHEHLLNAFTRLWSVFTVKKPDQRPHQQMKHIKSHDIAGYQKIIPWIMYEILTNWLIKSNKLINNNKHT